MNKDTIDVERLNEADNSESVFALLPSSSPLAVPPSREHGWPPASPPPANIHEWEAGQPVIQCDQCRELAKKYELTPDQRKYISQQLRSNQMNVHRL